MSPTDDQAIRRAARRSTWRNARDPNDFKLLVDILGLWPAQDGQSDPTGSLDPAGLVARCAGYPPRPGRYDHDHQRTF